MIDTVIFDLDGTLLDTLTDLHGSVNYALERLRFPKRSAAEVRAFVGNGAEQLILRSAPPKCDRKTTKLLLDLFEEHYRSHSLDHTAPYEGILPLLEELKQRGFAMAVVSNKPAFATEALCKRFFGGLIFPAIGQRQDLPKKPAPDMLLEAMRVLKKEPAQCIYVGDSEVDVASSENAGLPLLAVDWGFRSRQQLLDAGADVIVSSPTQLLERLLSLQAKGPYERSNSHEKSADHSR